MSISQSLSNALSGLSVNSRAAEIVSNNVANAMTEGYGRREIQLSAQSIGGSGAGVKFDGVNRVMDEALLQDRWRADAAVGHGAVRSNFLAEVESLFGTPESPDSIEARLHGFERSLLEAASRPESTARQRSVADAAIGLATQLNSASDGIQELRTEAERGIAREVDTLNRHVAQVADINTRILVAQQSGQDISGLLDQRQKAVDGISSIVPLRVFERGDNKIALYTEQGVRLVDGEPARFEFERANMITPGMTVASGALKGLLVDGKPVAVTGQNNQIAGGKLAALFEVRDELAVAAQGRLDALARDLVERFEDPAMDATLAAGDPGLFTDAGAALDPVHEAGLAGRLAVSDAVLPERGGELWRLRDGVGAAAEGEVGDARLFQAMSDALSARRTPATGDFPGSQTASALVSELVSGVGVARLGAETDVAAAQGRQHTLQQMLRAGGVDTDHEMQKLMQIEQAFAANARVITVADEMLKTLMRI